MTALSKNTFSVMSDDVVHLKLTSIPDNVSAGNPFNMSVDLLDFFLHLRISNHSFNVTVNWASNCTACLGISLLGVRQITSVRGQSMFQNVRIEKSGNITV